MWWESPWVHAAALAWATAIPAYILWRYLCATRRNP